MRASWKVPAMPARQMASGEWPVIGVAVETHLAAIGGMRPETTLSSVVLPDPLGPTRPTTSPRATVNETPSSGGEAAEVALRFVDLEQGPGGGAHGERLPMAIAGLRSDLAGLGALRRGAAAGTR